MIANEKGRRGVVIRGMVIGDWAVGDEAWTMCFETERNIAVCRVNLRIGCLNYAVEYLMRAEVCERIAGSRRSQRGLVIQQRFGIES